MFDPDGDVEDGDFAAKYESVTPIFIRANHGPMIFVNNTFSENIGTIGGAIQILSPNFESHNATGYNSTQKPYVIMHNNNFTKNMAYFAGNAFHITSSVRLIEPYLDYLQMCGAGILIEENLFYGNIGMKRHNGGAGVVRCAHKQAWTDIFVEDHTTSGYPLH